MRWEGFHLCFSDSNPERKTKKTAIFIVEQQNIKAILQFNIWKQKTALD
jgi:hypothetical protein